MQSTHVSCKFSHFCSVQLFYCVLLSRILFLFFLSLKIIFDVSFLALLRVSSAMGVCLSGKPPLRLVMFVLRFCFCFWRNKYYSSSSFKLRILSKLSENPALRVDCLRMEKFSTYSSASNFKLTFCVS